MSAEIPSWKHAETEQLRQRDKHEFEGALQLDSDTMQSLIHAVEGLIYHDDDTEEALKNAIRHIALRLGYPIVWRQKDETFIRQEVDDQGILRSTSVP